DPLRSRVDAHELVRQDGAEGLKILLTVRAGALDESYQLVRRIPQRGVLEEQARSQARPAIVGFTMQRHLGGIEIEIHHASGTTRLLPLLICATGRHKRELSFELAQRGARQALDQGFAIAARLL